jgi:hypothetical protein
VGGGEARRGIARILTLALNLEGPLAALSIGQIVAEVKECGKARAQDLMGLCREPGPGLTGLAHCACTSSQMM